MVPTPTPPAANPPHPACHSTETTPVASTPTSQGDVSPSTATGVHERDGSSGNGGESDRGGDYEEAPALTHLPSVDITPLATAASPRQERSWWATGGGGGERKGVGWPFGAPPPLDLALRDEGGGDTAPLSAGAPPPLAAATVAATDGTLPPRSFPFPSSSSNATGGSDGTSSLPSSLTVAGRPPEVPPLPGGVPPPSPPPPVAGAAKGAAGGVARQSGPAPASGEAAAANGRSRWETISLGMSGGGGVPAPETWSDSGVDSDGGDEADDEADGASWGGGRGLRGGGAWDKDAGAGVPATPAGAWGGATVGSHRSGGRGGGGAAGLPRWLWVRHPRWREVAGSPVLPVDALLGVRLVAVIVAVTSAVVAPLTPRGGSVEGVNQLLLPVVTLGLAGCTAWRVVAVRWGAVGERERRRACRQGVGGEATLGKDIDGGPLPTPPKAALASETAAAAAAAATVEVPTPAAHALCGPVTLRSAAITVWVVLVVATQTTTTAAAYAALRTAVMMAGPPPTTPTVGASKSSATAAVAAEVGVVVVEAATGGVPFSVAAAMPAVVLVVIVEWAAAVSSAAVAASTAEVVTGEVVGVGGRGGWSVAAAVLGWGAVGVLVAAGVSAGGIALRAWQRGRGGSVGRERAVGEGEHDGGGGKSPV